MLILCRVVPLAGKVLKRVGPTDHIPTLLSIVFVKEGLLASKEVC